MARRSHDYGNSILFSNFTRLFLSVERRSAGIGIRLALLSLSADQSKKSVSERLIMFLNSFLYYVK
jgi:hypothetical protein